MSVSLIGHDGTTDPSQAMYQAARATPTGEAGGMWGFLGTENACGRFRRLILGTPITNRDQ